MKKRIVYGGGLAAVLMIVYFAFFYPWPNDENVQGTIGGVKKYNSPQISEKDVVLDGQTTQGTSVSDNATIEKAPAWFMKLPLEQRIQLLNTASLDKTLWFAKIPLEEQAKMFMKIPLNERIQYLNTASLDKTLWFAKIPLEDQAKMFMKIPLNERIQYLNTASLDKTLWFAKVPLEDQAKMFMKIPLNERIQLLNQAGLSDRANDQ